MASLICNILRQTPKLTRMAISVAATQKSHVPLVSLITRQLSMGVPSMSKIRVREPAPNFKGMAVINEEFKEIQLSDFKGKYVVLVFFPMAFTFVCPTELIAFNERIADFEKLNTVVIGCSIDSHYVLLAWQNVKREDGGLGVLRYPLLSDMQRTIIKDYDVLVESMGIALRGTFIIDGNGVLRHSSVNDLPIGRSVEESLRLIEAIRFHEEQGEVCPANWHKGGATIKPNPKDSKEYFKKQGGDSA